MPANTTFTAGQVLTAAQQNNFPLGVVTATAGGTSGIGYARVTGTGVVIGTAAADVTGMTVTFTAASNRLYRISLTLADVNSTSGFNPLVINIADGSNTTIFQTRRIFPAGDTDTISFSYVETGLTGSIVRKVRLAGITNTGTFNTNGGTGPSSFVIEDIGSVS